MALSRVTTWATNDVLTASALNGEFNNLLNNALSLISPLTGSLAAGDFNITGLGELALNDDGAPTAAGRARRSGGNLHWHDITGTAPFQLLVGGSIFGLTISRGGVTTMSVATGVAVDATQNYTMRLTTLLGGKLINAAWAVGQTTGMLDTGSVAASTWYHVHLIERVDTGVVDAVCSTSATAPTMPANYTRSRRLGSFRTNGSSQVLAFTQDGDYFVWAATVNDYQVTNPGTAAVSRTLFVPTGVTVYATMQIGGNVTTALQYYVSDLSANDEAPTDVNVTPPGGTFRTPGSQAMNVTYTCRTNTSAQVRTRCNTSDGSTIITGHTLGWFDRRGRDA